MGLIGFAFTSREVATSRRDRVSRRGKIDRGVEGLLCEKVLIPARIDATILFLESLSHELMLRMLSHFWSAKYCQIPGGSLEFFI